MHCAVAQSQGASIRLWSCRDPQSAVYYHHTGDVRISVNLRKQSRASFHVVIMPVFCCDTSYTWGKSALQSWYFQKPMNIV